VLTLPDLMSNLWEFVPNVQKRLVVSRIWDGYLATPYVSSRWCVIDAKTADDETVGHAIQQSTYVFQMLAIELGVCLWELEPVVFEAP